MVEAEPVWINSRPAAKIARIPGRAYGRLGHDGLEVRLVQVVAVYEADADASVLADHLTRRAADQARGEGVLPARAGC